MSLHFTVWAPPPPLAAHVSRLWHLRGDEAPADWLLPDVGGAEIAIYLGAPGRVQTAGGMFSAERFVVGGLSRARVLEHPAQVDVVGIQLAPGCACLLNDRPAALRDVIASVQELAPALDRDLARWAGGLWGHVDLRGLAAVVANHVAGRCDHLMTSAGALLARNDDPARVEHLSARSGLSRRQFSRRFRSAFGVTARDFIQLARFARACRLASTTRSPSWSGLSAQAGYADQSHLVRDFQQLVGLSPTRVFSREWYASLAPRPCSDGPSIQDRLSRAR